MMYNIAMRRNQIERTCEQCAIIFTTCPSNIKYHGARFCSKVCKDTFNRGRNSYAWREKPIRTCQNCKIFFSVDAWRLKEEYRGKFCTKKCQIDYRKGENSANWKGGITNVNRRLRSKKDIRDWRKSVLERDGYKCMWCASTKSLEVDHIKSFALYPELRTIVSNGRVLCRSCHIKTFIKVAA